MANSLLNERALAAVGQHRPPRPGLVTARDIRKFCIAVDDRHPPYLDPEAARAAGHADVIAPPLFPASATRPVPFEADLLPDGQYSDLAPPGLEHLQSLLAGQEWDFIRPAVAGEQIVEDCWIGSIEERQGRNGPLVFVLEESLISTVGGDPILRSRNQLIFREPPPPPPPHSGEVAALPESRGPITSFHEGTMTKRPSSLSLFMFDAAIWATHRLHWDAAQARHEGLPAPIIPGWMMSAYLTEFMRSRIPAHARLTGLSLRFKAYGFAGDEFTCLQTASDESEYGLSLINQNGEEIMAGTGNFS